MEKQHSRLALTPRQETFNSHKDAIMAHANKSMNINTNGHIQNLPAGWKTGKKSNYTSRVRGYFPPKDFANIDRILTYGH